MDYKGLLACLSRREFAQTYLLHGEERYLFKELETCIIEALLTAEEREMGLTIFDEDPGIEALAQQLTSTSFFGGKNVILLRHTQLFKSRKSSGSSTKVDEGQERLIELLQHIPEDSYLILAAEKVDKKRKLYKALEKSGIVVEVAPLKTSEIREWVSVFLNRQGMSIRPDAVEYLARMLGVMPTITLGFLASELEKAALYCYPDKVITKQALTAMLAAVPEVSVFAMLEAMSVKDVSQALSLLHEQLRLGQHPLALTGVLAHQVRKLWQARQLAESGMTGRAVAGVMRVPPFVGDKLVRQSKAFSHHALQRALLELAQANYDLKYSSMGAVLLEKIIIELCA